MSITKKLEAKDSRLQTQFSRFVLVGGISTAINYALFFVLYTLLSANYIVASATGYIVGALFGYVFNARLTFRSRTGLSVFPYFIVYTCSLVAGLGVLNFQVASLKVDPLIANIVAIGFTTVTNFLGTKYVVFNPDFRLPAFFRNRLFASVLFLKLILSALFASDYATKLFVPFVKYFVENPLSNPYQHFFEAGITNAFPYPPLMLFLLSVPFIILYAFKSAGPVLDVFALRLPLLFADIVIFYILHRLFPKKEYLITLLYWCSPVVIYITYIHGQLDVVPVAMLFASIYALLNKRVFVSALFLGLGLATKSYIIAVLPIYLIYLAKKKYFASTIAKFVSVVAIVYAVFLLPYLFSAGFAKLVFYAPEQYRIFSLSANFTSTLAVYILPAVYAFIVLKAYSFKKITKDVLFVFLGLLFTVLVTFLNPERGWYLWSIPFIVYFFVKEKKLSVRPYAAFNVFYLLYFIFVHNSDVFNVLQIIVPSLSQTTTPYAYLSAHGVSASTIVNLLFTALTTTLLYTIYVVYKNGVKSSLIFQEKNGIPVIGISGDSGTGKTTLAECLSNFFGRQNVTLVYGDDMHKWERYDEHWNRLTHLNPAGNLVHMHYKQVRRLKDGYPVRRRHYDHKKGKFTKPILIKPKDIIISEGLHTLFINESNVLYELKIYLDPDPSLRLWWKLRRDVKERKYSAKQVVEQLKKREKDSEKFISPQRYYSDIIISYRPAEKIDFKNLDKDTELYVELYVKNDIPIEPLLGVLSDCKTLGVQIDYPDNRFQKVMFRGTISTEELQAVTRRLEIDYKEYDIDMENMGGGLDGLLHVMVLYCLNERLKSMQKVDELGY